MNKTALFFTSILAVILAIICIFTTFSSLKLRKKENVLLSEIEQLKSDLAKTEQENVRLKARLNQKTSDSPSQPIQITSKESERKPVQNTEKQRFDIRDRDPADIVENMRNRMEDMKNNNPELYNQIVQRMNDFTLRLDKELKDRIEYLKEIKIDESLMTADEIENYNKLIDIMENNSKTVSYLAENPEADDAPTLRMELFQSARGTRELLQTARKIAIKNIGIQNGLSGDKLKEFEENVNKAYDMTSFAIGRFGEHRPARQ